MKDRLDELFYNVGRSLYDDEHVLLREKDFEWLIETVEEQQATIDTLSMAHDNMARELSLFKEKDKHELIKSNIALNKRVQELEHDKTEMYKLNRKLGEMAWKIEQQNKRYREAIVRAINENGSVGDNRFVVNQILENASEGEE